jgi:hypothetical protein
MIRSTCSECASAHIVWLPLSRLASRVAPGARARAKELRDFFGPSGAEAWLCDDCGCFGAVQFGSFASGL